VLDVARSIHTLVFGLVLVGIVGLGPTAGILAIALHSMGTYGKLFAESIETLDMAAIDAVRSVGAGPAQVFFNAIWPPCCRSSSPATSTSGSSTSATRPSSA
jgi:phosphonate transport system permease protein